jgi:hypothetical protein
MLPVTAAARRQLGRAVDVVWIADVNVNVLVVVIMAYVFVPVIIFNIPTTPAAAPAPSSTPSSPKNQSGPKRQGHSGGVARIRIRIIGIGGRSVDDDWIVGRNIDDFRISLLNDDDLLAPLNSLCLDFLLGVGF